jgi:hypothetical protein
MSVLSYFSWVKVLKWVFPKLRSNQGVLSVDGPFIKSHKIAEPVDGLIYPAFIRGIQTVFA